MQLEDDDINILDTIPYLYPTTENYNLSKLYIISFSNAYIGDTCYLQISTKRRIISGADKHVHNGEKGRLNYEKYVSVKITDL